MDWLLPWFHRLPTSLLSMLMDGQDMLCRHPALSMQKPPRLPWQRLFSARSRQRWTPGQSTRLSLRLGFSATGTLSLELSLRWHWFRCWFTYHSYRISLIPTPWDWLNGSSWLPFQFHWFSWKRDASGSFVSISWSWINDGCIKSGANVPVFSFEHRFDCLF